MNAKTTVALLICLVAVVGGLYFFSGDSSEKKTDTPTSHKLFELEFGDVKSYEIKPGDEPVRSFTKIDDSNWRMTAPIEGQAQPGIVESDVRKILDLEYDKAYGQKDDPPKNDLTSLDTPKKVIKLTDTDGKTHVLKLGNRQQLSDKTYVQRVGDETIYLVAKDLNKDLDKQLSEYRGKRLMEFRASDVNKIEVTGETNYVAIKKDAGWTIESPVKARADVTTLNRAASGIANLFVVDYIEDNPKTLRPYGLETPRLIATLEWQKKPADKTEDGEDVPMPAPAETATTKIAFGSKVDNNVFARLIEADGKPVTVFQVSETVLKNLTPTMTELRDKRIADFAQQRANKIEYTTPDATTTLTKSNGKWSIQNDAEPIPADIRAVDDFLRAVKNLKAEGFEEEERPAFGLANPRATIRIEVEGEVQSTLLAVGEETPSKTGVYVQNVNDNSVAVVSIAEAKNILIRPVSFNSRDIFSFDANAVSGFKLRRGNESVELAKVDDQWRMKSPIDGAGNQANISAMLAALSKLSALRVVGRDSEISLYGLDAPQYSMEISLSGDDVTPIAFTAIRQDGSRYLKSDDGRFIYEIEERILTELDKEFLDTKLFSFDATNVNSITFTGDDSVTFNRSADGPSWTLEGESTFAVANEILDQTIGTLAGLSATRFVSYTDAEVDALGLSTPWRTVMVSFADGTNETLEIADKGPNAADRYARLASEPMRAFVLTGTDVAMFNKSAIDFKK